MAIHEPGVKFRHSRLLSKHGKGRDVTVVLSLTAMVDMFTVLVIFLLQNYNATGEVLYIPKEVTLPKAESIKELKPSHVVTVSNKEILLDKDVVAKFGDITEQKDWMIPVLEQKLKDAMAKTEAEERDKMSRKLKMAIDKVVLDPKELRKVTIQADKGVTFLTLKKVMYTVTEAGASEINFAVTKQAQK